MGLSSSQQVSGRFVNPHIKDIKRNLWDAVLWRLGFYREKHPRLAPPRGFFYPANPMSLADPLRPSALWVGHSTFIIQVNGLTFLTDPVFSSYCSPIHFQVFRRQQDLAITIDDLPAIDCVLISHNHYDHLDENSVMQLHRRNSDIIWIVPQRVSNWFKKRGIHTVQELDWNQSHRVNLHCKITAVPAQHFSGRHLWDKNRTLWCGYIVECQDKKFYFVGDTGYNPIDFKEIGKKWPGVDLSLIPIGVYVPQKFMQPVHVNPHEAVKIHCDVGSRLSLGMHWKTFCLSEEPTDLPPYDLYLAMKEQGLAYETFLPIEPGQSINW